MVLRMHVMTVTLGLIISMDSNGAEVCGAARG